MINKFIGVYRFLSNFYEQPFEWNGITYTTSEHAYQAAKATNLADFEYVKSSPTPRIAKMRGREIKMNDTFEGAKDGIMLSILKAKFAILELADMLKATGDKVLIEGNTWHDNYWGDCSCDKCSRIKGLNRLGILLMNIRAKL